MLRRLFPLLTIVLVLAMACSDDDSTPPPATATIGSGSPAAQSPTAGGTSSSGSPAARTPTFGPIEGTVNPANQGGTDPVKVGPIPNPLPPAPQGIPVLEDVRVGAHPEDGGWDRIVFEFQSDLPGGRIEYVRSVAQCGSGMPVQLRGNAILQVKLDAAQAHNEAGQATIRANQLQGPGGAILEARQTCDFEADEWAARWNLLHRPRADET